MRLSLPSRTFAFFEVFLDLFNDLLIPALQPCRVSRCINGFRHGDRDKSSSLWQQPGMGYREREREGGVTLGRMAGCVLGQNVLLVLSQNRCPSVLVDVDCLWGGVVATAARGRCFHESSFLLRPTPLTQQRRESRRLHPRKNECLRETAPAATMRGISPIYIRSVAEQLTTDRLSPLKLFSVIPLYAALLRLLWSAEKIRSPKGMARGALLVDRGLEGVNESWLESMSCTFYFLLEPGLFRTSSRNRDLSQ